MKKPPGGGGEEVRGVVFKIFALAFASFAFGFSLCNVIHVFFSPYSKRSDCNSKTASTNKQGKDGNNF